MSNTFFTRIAAAAFIGLATVGATGATVSFAGPAMAAPAPSVGPSTTGMYGDPTEAAEFWAEQSLDDCTLMAIASVVGQVTGDMPTEAEIIELAENTPSTTHPGSIYIRPANPEDPNTGNGTDPHDAVVLLAHYGIDAEVTDTDSEDETGVDTGMKALQAYLAAGDKVIVSVNAETIWDIDGPRNQSNHSVSVIGVDVKNGIVHLNDSGTEDGRDEQVDIATFMKAWKTSDYRMIVTEEAA